MAITATLHELLSSLRIEPGSSLLEIGEANWYGDINPQSVGLERHESRFAICKDFYRQWFAPDRIVSIDMHGSPAARRDDLNGPIELGERFDVVINHGTAEHVFNIGQVFKTIHDHCGHNGWMIHEAPFTGWHDHGFYCLQPTLFYDLALANCYEVTTVAAHDCQPPRIISIPSRLAAARMARDGELPANSCLFVVFRKRVDQPFKIPMQGYYSGAHDALAASWEQAKKGAA